MARRAIFASAAVVAGLLTSFFLFSDTLLGQPTALTVVSRDGRRSLATTVQNEQDYVALDDLAAMFQLALREDPLGVTVSYKGKTIVLTLDQPLASVSGRLISLPATPIRNPARRWLVPAEFISRALALIYDARLDLRRPARLLLVGDVRAPRLQVRYEPVGTGARLTVDAAPRDRQRRLAGQRTHHHQVRRRPARRAGERAGAAAAERGAGCDPGRPSRGCHDASPSISARGSLRSRRHRSSSTSATRLVIDLTAATVAEAAPAVTRGALRPRRPT